MLSVKKEYKMEKERDLHRNIELARRIYLLHPEGVSDRQLAEMLDVSRATGNRVRIAAGAEEVGGGRYTITPSNDDVEVALLVLKRAGRLPS
jgi:vacuolar-type H+-ATPase subunit E/Vma4